MNSTKAAKKDVDSFIPADESPLYLLFFGLTAQILFRFHFHQVLIANRYRGYHNRRTLYYANHTSWWDGLIPLLLNRKIFRQRARALMEDKQMRRYPFFRKLGAFSVNLSDKRSLPSTLSQSLDTLKREKGALYLYPEGEIRPFSSQDLTFEKGLAWILKRCDPALVDTVPVSIYMHTAFSSRPQLNIHIGEPVPYSPEMEISELNRMLEERLCNDLQETAKLAFHHKEEFEIRV